MRRGLVVALIAAVAAGCGGSGSGGASGETLTVWNLEYQPDRLAATEAILADFTEETGIPTRQVAIGEDQMAPRMEEAVAAGELPDVVLAASVALSQRYAAEGRFDARAAQDVVERLGEDTFSRKALDLVSHDGVATGVPSDGWGQLLIYRRDLFDEAGLPAPQTLDDVRAAAAALNSSDMAGITLGTTPGDGFTAETFEHVALAGGCRLVDEAGEVTFDSPECVEALRYYGDLARFSAGGRQDVDSTRDAYFAGKAAMVFWSPFLLDGMAGLRDDARPTCPECRADPAYLARNSGLVGPLAGAGGEPSQFGSVGTFNISTEAPTEDAQRLVEYLMSDGYVRWLALSPQGKYPVRKGDEDDPDRYAKAWASLESGVDRRAPLSRFYSEESIASLGEGVDSFQRWGFAEGQGALVGALSDRQPVARAVADVIAGKDPGAAARQVQRAVERIKARLP